jgi:hypothetical protein
MTNHQFFGRYFQPELLPRSLDGLTNVNICGATIKVDVPDLEEKIPLTDVAATGITWYDYQKHFFNVNVPPVINAIDENNKECTVERIGGLPTKNIDGNWFIGFRLWNGSTQIAGKIWGTQEGY